MRPTGRLFETPDIYQYSVNLVSASVVSSSVNDTIMSIKFSITKKPIVSIYLSLE
jgi:hypothetical protein